MTQAGVILGTAAYMSPEQAKGRVVDKRTDIWAFGCVFYEMLTARRAFAGEDVTDTIAAMVRGEPDWSALPKDTPPQIRLLLKRCLDKDRRARICDISVARFLMNERIELPTSRPVPAWRPDASPRGRSAIAAGLARRCSPRRRRVGLSRAATRRRQLARCDSQSHRRPTAAVAARQRSRLRHCAGWLVRGLSACSNPRPAVS